MAVRAALPAIKNSCPRRLFVFFQSIMKEAIMTKLTKKDIVEVRNDLDCSWHNFVNGSKPLEQQLAEAQDVVYMIKGLMELKRDGVIRITGGDSWPSVVWYEVLKPREYDQQRGQWGLLSRFSVETEVFISPDPPSDWDYENEEQYYPKEEDESLE